MPFDPRTDPRYKNDRLLLALTHQESRFNPNAVSPTGARGLTQVLPSTARSPGFGIAPSTAALTDPEANMAFGKAYLNAMQKRYNGDNAAALVAYNGGPKAADRWLANGKNDKVLSKETSNYYKSVLSKAGEGYDFSKVKVKLPKSVPSSEDDDDEETGNLTGFAKLKKPGSKSVDKPVEGEDSDNEEAREEEEKKPAKVKEVKASKEEDDDDDDEEDDEKGGKGSSKGATAEFDTDAYKPKLNPFVSGPRIKPISVQLGIPKLQLGALEIEQDDPRDR